MSVGHAIYQLYVMFAEYVYVTTLSGVEYASVTSVSYTPDSAVIYLTYKYICL